MVILRFDTADEERRALGWLAGRFSFKTWANGETLVPSAALASLALAGLPFRSWGRPPISRTLGTDLSVAPAA